MIFLRNLFEKKNIEEKKKIWKKIDIEKKDIEEKKRYRIKRYRRKIPLMDDGNCETGVHLIATGGLYDNTEMIQGEGWTKDNDDRLITHSWH